MCICRNGAWILETGKVSQLLSCSGSSFPSAVQGVGESRVFMEWLPIILIVGVCARAPLAPTRCWEPAEGLMPFSASVCMAPCRDRPCLCLSPVLLRSDVAEQCENLTLRCFEEVPWGSRSGSSMGPARTAWVGRYIQIGTLAPLFFL